MGFPAALFLCWAALTGILVAFTEFFGEEEALRERTRDLVSHVTLASPSPDWLDPVGLAFSAAAARFGSAPVDKVLVQYKGDQPTVTIYTGRPTGGEDRKLVFDARNGALLANESYADKPLLYRLHSGEAFGDGGLVVAMFWGLTLIVLTVTGIIIYFMMRKSNLPGIRKVFW